MNKCSSLPLIKEQKKLKRVQLRRINRSVVKRLYLSEVKKMKLRNNSFWHKTREDTVIEKEYKNVRKRKLLPLKPNSCFLDHRIERPEINNLIKLQQNMRKNIIVPVTEDSENAKRSQGRTVSVDQSEFYYTEHFPKNSEEFSFSIHEHKSHLEFVKTRIKVIMTTLPKLRETLEIWPKSSTQYTNIAKKIEKLVGLLKTYENAKEKIKHTIQACENTLDMQKKTPLYL